MEASCARQNCRNFDLESRDLQYCKSTNGILAQRERLASTGPVCQLSTMTIRFTLGHLGQIRHLDVTPLRWHFGTPTSLWDKRNKVMGLPRSFHYQVHLSEG